MRQLQANIDLDRLSGNIGIVMEHIPEEVNVIGVVKSGGYGHGADMIANRMLKSGIGCLAVSDIDEGIALRRKCADTPILVLGEIEEKYLAEAVSNDLTITLSSLKSAERLSKLADAMETRIRVHLKVDTGMGRFGIPPDQAQDALIRLSKEPFIDLEGLFSHLGTTFSDDEDSNLYTSGQIDTFDRVCKQAAAGGLLPRMVHIGSSTALIGFGDRVLGGFNTAIRIGTLFLGYEERRSDWKRHVVPVAEVHTRICMLRDLPPGRAVGYAKTFVTDRDTRLAILPVGYGHGFHRDFGNTGQVLIDGSPFPVVGKPSLGQVFVDVTGISDVAVGDRVTLAGPEIPANEQGTKIGRGTWEVLLPLLEHCEKSYL